MSERRYDVVGIGNAIVDVISQESEDFITEHELVRGAMTLVDADRATQLYAVMAPAIETSGGSAANTMAGLASFGADVAYIGKVRDDQLGDVFAHDIRAVGVDFEVGPGTDGPPTARCLIVVTPDAARTMNTFLGISSHLHPDDIDTSMVADRAGPVLRGLHLGHRADQDGHPQGRRRRTSRRQQGVLHALGQLLRRTPPRRVARTRRRAHRHLVRQRRRDRHPLRHRRLRRGRGHRPGSL